MEQPNKWIFDIHAEEMINLKDLRAVWISADYEKEGDCIAKHQLSLSYYRDTSNFYLLYETSALLKNAFDHYKQLLGCEELDVSSKPLTL